MYKEILAQLTLLLQVERKATRNQHKQDKNTFPNHKIYSFSFKMSYEIRNHIYFSTIPEFNTNTTM